MIANAFVPNDTGIPRKITDIAGSWHIESTCILVYLFRYINVLIR